MTDDFASPLEDRLRAALTEVAENVSVDPLPAMWSDEGARRAPLRRVRTLAVAALAAALAVGVGFAVANAGSTNDARPTPASTPPSTTPPTPAVALECPSKPPRFVQPQRVPGTKTTLVPGRPTALLACRYHGSNQPEPAGTLAKSASFPPGPIATGLNTQPAIPPGFISNCPNDEGEKIVLLFGYADKSRLTVSMSTAGCRYASNGDRVVHGDPATLDRLQAVLGKDAWANDATPTSNPTPASTAPSTTPATKPPTSTAALDCPSAPPSVLQPQPISGTDTTLVPGTPTALLACRYHGFNQPEPIGTLANAASFSPGPIATGLDSQPAIPPGVVSNCPADFGETILLHFTYADDSTLTVSISTAGCRYASNGSRTVHVDPATLDRLQAVLGKDTL
jgi:hypothetical protein